MIIFHITLISINMEHECHKCHDVMKVLDATFRYSGVIMGIDNMLGAVVGIMAPPIVGAMTESVSMVNSYSKVQVTSINVN